VARAFDRGRVEQAIGVLAIAGLIVMAVRGPRRQLAVVLAFLALQIELAGYEDNFANRWQLQSPEWPFMALAAAAVPSLLLDWLPPISSSLKLSIGLCCLLGGSLLCKWAMPPLSDQQEEWRFLRAHEDILTKANPSLPIVRFARGDDEDPAFPAFPSYRLRGDVPLYSIKDLFSGKVPLPALYFRGPHCYTKYGSFDFAGDERPLCAELERRYRMEPVVTETLHSRSFTGTRVGPPSFEIGYYRITGTR